jgi:hypothetical protein
VVSQLASDCGERASKDAAVKSAVAVNGAELLTSEVEQLAATERVQKLLQNQPNCSLREEAMPDSERIQNSRQLVMDERMPLNQTGSKR